MTCSADSAAGVFISFEGGDGAGKSTHMAYLCQAISSLGREVVRLREPGGTPIGEQLRQIVLDPANQELSERAELFIYEAARAQLTHEVIRPALERGAVVVCDRFFDSTMAYQGYGRGLDQGFIDTANRFATQGLVPDRTVAMFAPTVQEGLSRAGQVCAADRMELAGADFHQRVEAGFFACAKAQPQRIRVVFCQPKRSQTARLVFQCVEDLIPGLDRLLEQEDFGCELDECELDGGSGLDGNRDPDGGDAPYDRRV